MQQHILITKEMRATMPETTKVIFETYIDTISFAENDPNDRGLMISGMNAIVEDTPENLLAWFKPFKEIWVGNGVPQLESFELMQVNDEVI